MENPLQAKIFISKFELCVKLQIKIGTFPEFIFEAIRRHILKFSMKILA